MDMSTHVLHSGRLDQCPICHVHGVYAVCVFVCIDTPYLWSLVLCTSIQEHDVLEPTAHSCHRTQHPSAGAKAATHECMGTFVCVSLWVFWPLCLSLLHAYLCLNLPKEVFYAHHFVVFFPSLAPGMCTTFVHIHIPKPS